MIFWHRLRRSWATILTVVILSSVAAGTFSYITAFRRLSDFGQGVLDGFFISLLVIVYVTLGRQALNSFFKRFTFLVALVIHAAIYSILFLVGRVMGQVVGGNSLSEFFSTNFAASVVFAFGVFGVMSFLLQVNRLVGHNVLGSFISGKYHAPIEETRVFMFIDLERSTGLAEQLGDRRFHQLLNAFFYDLTEAVLACDGNIYKYVGDEMIVTWRGATERQRWQGIECFFLMQTLVAQHATEYAQQFGVQPSFRAGLHAGRVIAGELGDVMQEIAYVGDVLNTTARLLEQCRALQTRLLVSEAIVQDLPPQEGYTLTEAGEFQPRGKQQGMKVFRVENNPSPALSK